MSLSNPHNTTSGDNSSDSASNKKNSCRTELEIIESKLKKCTNEIEGMKKKVQSKQKTLRLIKRQEVKLNIFFLCNRRMVSANEQSLKKFLPG